MSSTKHVGKNEAHFGHWAEQLTVLIYLIIKGWIRLTESSPPI